ncbi:unnamed protein product [Heligmosomoides polygyrus]|uniref:Uncharacterized protein n=1 Tax=Heligmosomoides polygyrus TaxID=6339 RepID=A0A3P8FHM1_HELPZ|nr:unnamed protein product [Heligmosomoides polygyrus]
MKNSVAVGLTNGDVLLFGGWDESRTMKTVFRLSFDECHTSLDTKMETMLPSEVEAHSCVVHGDYVYIIGGYDGISVVDSIVRYSISNRTSEVSFLNLVQISDTLPYHPLTNVLLQKLMTSTRVNSHLRLSECIYGILSLRIGGQISLIKMLSKAESLVQE